MSEPGNRRPLIIAVSGIAATVALYLAYQKFYRTPSTAASSLHRSNAVRRSRRRWRRGFAPRDLGHNPLDKALDNLRARITESRPYGRYHNRSLQYTLNEDDVQAGLFDLLPANLDHIFTTFSQIWPMTELEKDKLKFHIEALFLQNFLQEEFPHGWIIGEDVETLIKELGGFGIDQDRIRMMVDYFDHGKPLLPDNWDVRDEAIVPAPSHTTQQDGSVGRGSTQRAIEALAGPPRGVESDSSDEDDDDDDDSDPGGSQNMLDLLYHIASDQANREGFIHRDVVCDSCGQKPIQGIRYHCSNCFDCDLCEDCEAQQIHNKTHVFYKVRIPAPPRGRIKQVNPVWYPGQPNAFPSNMPRDLQRHLIEKVGMDKTEMEASYEQFKCLAGEQIPIEEDPARLGMAISRSNFDMFFTTSSADRPPIPNLIHDRIFAFYDINNDGVITLDEYIIGIFTLLDKSRGARLDRMFKGYDLDADGYVDRKDFLRMFRAYYALSKEHNQEMISLQTELDDDIRDYVQGSQPISAAFHGHSFISHESRGGQDKEVGPNGDLVITDGPDGVLQNDTEMRGDRVRAIGNAAIRDRWRTHPFRSFQSPPGSEELLLYPPAVARSRSDTSVPLAAEINRDLPDSPDPGLHVYGWPPQQTPEPEDIAAALGVNLPLEDVTDPVDRSRVIYAQVQRLDNESNSILEAQRDAAVRDLWRRRQFYLDEEEGLTKPPGYTEPDSSEDEAATIDTPPEVAPQTSQTSRRQSMRSRSSSKVRFEDSTIDTDHETRSNTSSRSVPTNERWGGFELSAPERDIGREILYQAVQRGFNELLDPLFKWKEDEALTAIATKGHRIKWAKEIDEYETEMKKKMSTKAKTSGDTDPVETQIPVANDVGGVLEDNTSTSHVRPSTPTTDHDETDHIQIMFGNSPSKPPSIPNTPEPSTSEPSKTRTSPEEESIDPTLPQNRPNEPGTDPSRVADKSKSASAKTTKTPSKPSDTTLATWVKHRKVEEEAITRGGYGKLSYREFCRLMIKEANHNKAQQQDLFGFRSDSNSRSRTGERTGRDDGDGDGDTNGGANGGSSERHEDGDGDVDGARNGNIEADDEDDIDERTWSSSGDLGKMSFCGTWLEMSQF